jgi:hypothetical protein
MKREVLITGASIAGPALAWWLSRFGMTVTVVERSPAFRDGGQNIDVRGAGRTVIQRMGLEEAVAQRSTGEEGIAFVDEANRVKAQLNAEQFGSNGPTAELELLRGDLARLLVEHSRGQADYVFGDRIRGLDDRGSHVEVTLERGGRRRFGLVIAAEGIGSSTRALLFGGAVNRVPFDLYTAYFTIPRGETDGKIARWFNAPGGRSVFLRPDNPGTTQAFAAYERILRPYVEQAQDAPKLGPRIAQPQTRAGIALQQTALSLATKPGFSWLAVWPGRHGQRGTAGLTHFWGAVPSRSATRRAVFSRALVRGWNFSLAACNTSGGAVRGEPAWKGGWGAHWISN